MQHAHSAARDRRIQPAPASDEPRQPARAAVLVTAATARAKRPSLQQRMAHDGARTQRTSRKSVGSERAEGGGSQSTTRHGAMLSRTPCLCVLCVRSLQPPLLAVLMPVAVAGSPHEGESIVAESMEQSRAAATAQASLALNPSLLPVHVPSASSLSLNPRTLSNSFHTPPPVHPHLVHHQRIKDKVQQQNKQAQAQADATTTGDAIAASNPTASPPAINAASASSPSASALAAQVAQLQSENAALRTRLRRLEEHNISIPPTIEAQADIAKPTHRSASYALSPAPSPPPESSNHWEEHHAIAAWQHSQALEMPLPTRQNIEQFDAEPLLTAEPAADAAPATVAASARLHRDVSSLLSHLQPSRRSESRRATVLAFLKLLVRKSLGAQVYALGAFALKTYVGGDEGMDVSAFFSRAHENTWLHRIVNALCQEASSNHHNQNNVHATTTTSPHTAVSELSVSFSKQQPYICATIGGIQVQIRGNAVRDLSSLALFERMDLLCAQQHLFKRTVILVKSWALSKNILNFSRSSVAQGADSAAADELTSHAPADGLLSGLFLRTLVLFIFNARAASIRTPLEGLYRLLQYLRDFDWDEHALTLDGAVTIKSLEAHGVGSRQAQQQWEYVQRGAGAWPAHTTPFLSAETIAQYTVTPRESSHSKQRAEASGTPVSRTASATSLNAASPAFSPNRAHSDASLASLPARVAAAAAAPTPLSPGIAHSPSFSSLDSDSLDQSPALSAANSMGGAGKATFAMHSQSYSNLQQLSAHQQQPLSQRATRSSMAHSVDSAFSPSHSHDGSVSLTPSHSSVDLQQLMLGINQTTGAAGPSSNSNNRLGFISGVPTTTLRSSASAAHLHRMPLPVSASSSSFFSSHAADAFESDSDSPDALDDDEPTRGTVRGVHQSVLSSQSLDDEGADAGIEGREFWDVGNDETTQGGVAPETDAASIADSGSAPVAPSGARPLSSFVRCSLNVLDPVDSAHNLGVGISYRHEGHIRSVLRDGFVDLQHALHKFAFAHAAQQIQDTDDGGELDLHPVLRELFEDSILSRYNELRNRESRGKRILAGSPVPAASTVALSASASVGDMASLWSTPVAAPAQTSSALSNSTPLLFESHSASSRLSPPRSLSSAATAFMLNPHSTQFVPAIISGGTATSNVIVDDAAVDPRTQAAVASASAAALASTDAVSVSAAPSTAAFDSLSGDLDKIVANLSHARQFETPDLSEDQLVHLIVDLLRERSSVPVGRMGSLLHQRTNCHSLPAMLKEQFGGLKNLLQRHPNIFVVGRDHPYNPSCSLRPKHWEHMTHTAHTKTQTHNANAQSSQQAMLSSSQPVPSAMTLSSSDGGLDSLALTAPASLGDGPNGRRKLQRRRTRTRRTNSGAAAAAASVAAVNAVRAGIASGTPLSFDPRTQLSSSPSLPPSSTPTLRLSSHPSPRPALTAVLALDCEMVGGGPSGLTSLLARVSVVNQHGEVMYDRFVRPSEPVTDYRTAVSGITPAHLESGLDARQVQREVSQLLKSRILVGHGLLSDLQALCLSVPKSHLRDTSLFRLLCPHRPLPLKQLVQEHLGHLSEFARFQLSEHDPVQDARAALALYKLVSHQWETMLAQEAQSGAMHHAHSQPNLSTMQHTHNTQQQQQREVYAAPSLPPHQQTHQPLQQQQPSFHSPQQQPQQHQQQQSYQPFVSTSHSPQVLYALHTSPSSRPPSHLSPSSSHLLHSSAASSPPTHPSPSSAVHIGAYRQQQPTQNITQHLHWQQQPQQQQHQSHPHPSMQPHPQQLTYSSHTQQPSQLQRFHASF